MCPSPPDTPRVARYRVSLTERASVVARGEQVELWFVRVNDAWVRAIEHPSASVEASSIDQETALSISERSPSGTIWLRTTELMLPAGTHLLQRQSSPRPRKLTVMSYLKQGLSTTQRVVRERHFVVTGNYRLTPVGRMVVGTVAGADANADADDSGSLSDTA